MTQEESIVRGSDESQRRSSPAVRRGRVGWLWARFAADVVGTALLGWALRNQRKRGRRHRSLRVPLGLSAVAGLAIFDGVRAVRATRAGREDERAEGEELEEPSLAVTIDRDRETVYRFFRDPANLARFVSYVDDVQVRSDGRVAITVTGPVGRPTRFLAIVARESEGESLTWSASTVAGDPICGGVLRLSDAPKDRGTEVRLALDGMPSSGGRGVKTAMVRMWTRVKVTNDLRRAKQILEVGESAKSDASVHSGPHAARPERRGSGNGALLGNPVLREST